MFIHGRISLSIKEYNKLNMVNVFFFLFPYMLFLGSVTVKSNGYAGQAVYSCAPDYRLVGVSERTCQRNDTWSDEAPTCEATKCSPPQDLAYGDIEYTDLSPGAVIRLLGVTIDSHRSVCF